MEIINGNLVTNGKIHSERKTIELILPDGRVYTGERGAPLEKLLAHAARMG